MTKQEKYAIAQYNMVCDHLKIPYGYDDSGRTLLEEIVHMETKIEDFRRLCWDAVSYIDNSDTERDFISELEYLKTK